MKKLLVVAVSVVCAVFSVVSQAQAYSVGALLQVHNPTGGNPSNPEPAGTKSQFIMQNTSDAGVLIDSILWNFASPIFVDSTSAAPGFGGFRDYTVSPADTYGGLNPGENQITVAANSDVLTGYTGPTSFTNGANSLSLS